MSWGGRGLQVFRQCVRAIVAARENNPEMAPHNYDTEYIQALMYL